jgi:hypothetical protein
LLTRRRSQLERELQRECVSDAQRREYLNKLEARERDYTRLQRQRLSAADFEPLTIIGRGAFGEVPADALQGVMAWSCSAKRCNGCAPSRAIVHALPVGMLGMWCSHRRLGGRAPSMQHGTARA